MTSSEKKEKEKRGEKGKEETPSLAAYPPSSLSLCAGVYLCMCHACVCRSSLQFASAQFLTRSFARALKARSKGLPSGSFASEVFLVLRNSCISKLPVGSVVARTIITRI